MRLLLTLFYLTTFTWALDIKIHEGNIDFIEKATMTQDGNCLDLETPDHNGRDGIRERTCFDYRRQKAQYATGLNKTKICYITNNNKGSIEKQKNDARMLVTIEIPYNLTATTEKNMYVPSLSEVSNVNEVHPKLREFCKGMPMFWMNKVSSLKEAESDAMAQLTGTGKVVHQQNRQKRSFNNVFVTCSSTNDAVLYKCYREGKVRQLHVRCKFFIKCFFSIRSRFTHCPQTVDFKNHICCDFAC